MAKSLISLGANLGNPRQVMRQAGEMILEHFGGNHVSFSRLYRTPAVGGPVGQDDFFNAVAAIESTESAFEIWRSLHTIEQTLGRQRRDRWEARRIDLDVLMHNDERHWTPTLKVPHPRMVMRTFVLEPACEIASDWIEPVTGLTLEVLGRSLREMRARDIVGIEAVHVLVLSESTERISRLATALMEGTDRVEVSQSTPAAETISKDDHSVTIRLTPSRRISFQAVSPLGRPASMSEIDQVRDQLDRQINEGQASHPVHLLVFAGASPDPSLIHWEDYCRSWAEMLGLVGSGEFTSNATAFRRLPKYLLSAEDPTWAAHELRAAMTAMTCPIQACGAFFDA